MLHSLLPSAGHMDDNTSGTPCLSIGMAPPPAPPDLTARPSCSYLKTRAPRDVSDTDDDADDAPPARALFDVRACMPRDRTKAAEESGKASSKAADDAQTERIATEGGFVEMGQLLAQLQQDCAQPGCTPTDRMMGVCRVVLAFVASWLKPTQEVEQGALRQPGMLGYHNIRRVDLGRTADAPTLASDCVLNFQEQSVLRTVCFADHYLHVSQKVSASMCVHVKPRVVAQGGGSVLVLFDGMPLPPADPIVERQLADEHAAAVAAARERGDPPPCRAVPPARPPLVIELGGAAFYKWPKRYHVPEDAPPCTPPPRAVRDLDFDPEAGASVPATLRETYSVKLPALKLSGLTRRVPVVTTVRSAVITCEATGLVARIKFLPFRPLADAMHNVVIGTITAADAQVETHQPLQRRRSEASAPAPAGLGSALASIIPRRRSSLRRNLSETSVIKEAPDAELAAQQPTPRQPAETAAAVSAGKQTLTLYGVLDGTVCVSTCACPHPPGVGGPEASSSAWAGPAADVQVLYDDAVHGVTPAATVNTMSLTRNMAAALRSPSLMLQQLLWNTIVDALRTAVHERRVGAHPLTLDTLRRVLQREGPQVVVAKLKSRVGRQLRSMEFAASWILASRPTTQLPVCLEHLPPLPPAAAFEATPVSDEGRSGSGRSDSSWEVV